MLYQTEIVPCKNSFHDLTCVVAVLDRQRVLVLVTQVTTRLAHRRENIFCSSCAKNTA